MVELLILQKDNAFQTKLFARLFLCSKYFLNTAIEKNNDKAQDKRNKYNFQNSHGHALYSIGLISGLNLELSLAPFSQYFPNHLIIFESHTSIT